MSKPTVCVDFDGVLNTYKGWVNEDYLYEPREGAKQFLETLSEDYTVVIFTVRDKKKVNEWLNQYDMPFSIITDRKVGAVAYIDDRGLRFEGSYEKVLYELRNFKTHWQE